MSVFTFGMIKPDAIQHSEDIIKLLKSKSMIVKPLPQQTMSEEVAQKFYQEHAQQPFFKKLIEFMTSGPVQPLVIYSKISNETSDNLVLRLRNICGPTDPRKATISDPDCIRAQYGTRCPQNAFHASDSKGAANLEVQYFNTS